MSAWTRPRGQQKGQQAPKSVGAAPSGNGKKAAPASAPLSMEAQKALFYKKCSTDLAKYLQSLPKKTRPSQNGPGLINTYRGRMHVLYDYLAKTCKRRPPSILESHRPKQTPKVLSSASGKASPAAPLPTTTSANNTGNAETKSSSETKASSDTSVPQTPEEVAIAKVNTEQKKIQKRTRAIKKKLKQIAALKAKAQLSPAQQTKVATGPGLEKELAALGPKLAAFEEKIALMQKSVVKAKISADKVATKAAKKHAAEEKAAKKVEVEKKAAKVATEAKVQSRKAAKEKSDEAKKARALAKKRRKKEMQKLKQQEKETTADEVAAQRAAAEKSAAARAAKAEALKAEKARKKAEKKARKAAEGRLKAQAAAKEREAKAEAAAAKKRAKKNRQKASHKQVASVTIVDCACTDVGSVCAVCKGSGEGSVMDAAEAAQRLLIECATMQDALCLCGLEDGDLSDL